MEERLPRKKVDSKVSSIGGKTGAARFYPDNGDKGRGRHIKQAKRLNRRPASK